MTSYCKKGGPEVSSEPGVDAVTAVLNVVLKRHDCNRIVTSEQ